MSAKARFTYYKYLHSKKNFVLIVLKCGIKKYTVVSLFSIFLLVLFFLLAQGREGVIIPTGAEEEDWGSEKKGYLFFYLFEKELCSLLSQ